MNEQCIYVYLDRCGHETELLGRLYRSFARGSEHFAFEYDSAWLGQEAQSDRPRAILDPDLPFFRGRQYPPPSKPIFGLFADCCPDRWGRLLLKRREAILARQEKRAIRALGEGDFLLGIDDRTRLGALRFALEPGGAFVSDDEGLAIPPWASLRSLEAASLAFESKEGNDEAKWLRQLLAPGSSLGGARPKASVLAPDASLWIAKFPSRLDEWNCGAWEMLAQHLAQRCGLNTPPAKIQQFSRYGSTFLVQRFDRQNSNGTLCRLPFVSAMTLLGRSDGAAAEGASYLDLAGLITEISSAPQADLLELWKRLVLNVAISNTDDHLRNHGFVLGEEGWRLSPLYDVNPNPYGRALTLAIDENDPSLDFDLVLAVAPHFGLEAERARAILAEMQAAIGENWRALAKEEGLSRGEIREMEPAFRLVEH